MKPLYLGIYGETCAGKSTVGKHLASILGCRYVSFGDTKREEIAHGTKTGKEIQKFLELQKPIPPDLGYKVLKDVVLDGINVISGYPISEEEFTVLAKHLTVIGTIILTVNEYTLLQRFNLRHECPKCHTPGVVGDSCPTHQVPMIQRQDARQEELVFRRKLYQQRICPFLSSKQLEDVPRYVLDTSNLTKNAVAQKVERWLKQLLMNGGIPP